MAQCRSRKFPFDVFTNCFAKRLKALPHQSTRQTMDRFVPRDDNIFVVIAITIVMASEARHSKTRHCERSVAIQNPSLRAKRGNP